MLRDLLAGVSWVHSVGSSDRLSGSTDEAETARSAGAPYIVDNSLDQTMDPNGNEKKRVDTNSLVTFFGSVNHAFEVFVFLLVAIVAVAGIIEISARETALVGINKELESLKTTAVPSSGKSASEGESASQPAGVDSRFSELTYRRLTLERLIMVGARSDNGTLAGITGLLDEDQLMDVGAINIAVGAIQVAFGFLHKSSTDFILALAMLACGAMGAGVASIREGEQLNWRSLLFGISAGFVVFLGVRGGAHVFLIGSQGEAPRFNPFSCALVAILVGMFYGRFHLFLGVVVDAFFEKAKKIAES